MTYYEYRNLKVNDRIKINNRWSGKNQGRLGKVLTTSNLNSRYGQHDIIKLQLDNKKSYDEFHYDFIDIVSIETHGPGSFGDKVMSGEDIGGV